MEDKSLIHEFIEATGLPLEIAVRFLAELMVKENLDPQTVTVEDLRRLTKNYLMELLNDLPT